MITIVNLLRRTDRRLAVTRELERHAITAYSFFPAIDGKQLAVTDDIARQFAGNDFNSAAGVIGCAMSHIALWRQLVASTEPAYIILEDDIHIREWAPPTTYPFDIMFLGYTTWKPEGRDESTPAEFTPDRFVGGTFAYIISRAGAARLLEWIETHGVRHGIDYIMARCVPNLVIKHVQPHMVTSDWVTSPAAGDTDIQGCTDTLDLFRRWQFFPQMDHCGDDIERHTTRDKWALLRRASAQPEVTAFNTLGYLKSASTIKFTPSSYFSTADGLWCKRRVCIHVACNWCSSDTLVQELTTMMGTQYPNVTFKFTARLPADFFLVINFPCDTIIRPAATTIVIQWEPYSSPGGAHTWGAWAPIGPQAVTPAFWQLTDLDGTPPAIRHDRISIILSEKYFDPGHKYRVDFIRFIEAQNDPLVQVDVWGRENYHHFASYRGPVTDSKDTYIRRYKYYLSIENNREQFYISEKFWEPILCGTLPFYFGCTHMAEHLPSCDFLIELDADFATSFARIKAAIVQNKWEAAHDWIAATRRWTLDHQSVFSRCDRTVKRLE